MDERPHAIRTQDLNGHPVRTVRIDGTDFVSMEDFCGYLQGLVGKIVELTQRQGEHLTAVTGALDVLCEVLGEKHPELRQALMRAAQRPQRFN